MTAEVRISKIIEEKNYNMLVPWVLILSYGYYIRHDNLISDHTFDLMMKMLLKHFDEVEHVHKYLITKDDLKAGTMYGLKNDDYPKIVRGAWFSVLEEYRESKKKKR